MNDDDSGPVQSDMRFTRRTGLTALLLLATVPWWPGLEGTVAGLPAWAVYAFGASVVYAAVVAWLLERHWDDGSSDRKDGP